MCEPAVEHGVEGFSHAVKAANQLVWSQPAEIPLAGRMETVKNGRAFLPGAGAKPAMRTRMGEEA